MLHREALCSDPDGIRTRVAGVKGQCPRPLDDGAKQDLPIYPLGGGGVKGRQETGRADQFSETGL